jgi:hypothetical protein
MNELYEMANGSDIASVSTGKIAEKLSLDYKNEKDHRELLAIIKYLEGEYLIKSSGMMASRVRLTHEGIREVEQAKRQPDESTDHFAPIRPFPDWYAETELGWCCWTQGIQGYIKRCSGVLHVSIRER